MTTAMDEAEIVVLGGTMARTEAPSTSPSGSRSPSALRGGVTTSSPGFVRFQIRTARAPRPRLGQNPRKLPQAWLVVRVVKSQRIGGRPRQHLVRYLGSIHSDAITELGERARGRAGVAVTAGAWCRGGRRDCGWVLIGVGVERAPAKVWTAVVGSSVPGDTGSGRPPRRMGRSR